MASQKGLLDFCDPKVDDGIVTAPLLAAKTWSRSVVCQYNPNFHFAVVVLRDDIDEDDNNNTSDGVFVTLENWAVADPLALNDSWWFCVWSLPGSNNKARLRDTYPERLTESGGSGRTALTFRVRPKLE